MISPIPKTVNGKTRADDKDERRKRDYHAWNAVSARVDARDEGQCRVCGTRANPHVTTLLGRLHRHHIAYRSRGGEDITSNIVSLCAACHDEIHIHGTLHLEGDADLRDPIGRLCGIKVERNVESGWEVTEWV